MTRFRAFLVCAFCAGFVLPVQAEQACGPALAKKIMQYKSGDVNQFLKYDCVIDNQKWQIQETPLEWAIGGYNNIQDNYIAVKAFLDAKPELANSVDYGHKHITMLAQAVRSCCDDKEAVSKPKIVKELLDHGAEVNAVLDNIKNNNGTISHVIVIDESKRKVTALDVVRAYIESANRNGTACQAYGVKHCEEIEQILLSHGAKTYAELNGEELTPVQQDTPTVVNAGGTTEMPVPVVGGKTVSVSGTVTDATTGETLPGVNIALVDSDGKRIPNKGCTTNLEGKFTGNFDNVPDGAKIEASFVGYKKQSFDLGQDLQIKLESGKELDAVVISGEFCTEEMLKTLNAVKGHKQDTEDGKAVCAPDECIDNYELRDGACVAKTDGGSTDKAPGDDGNNTPDATTPAPQIDNSKEIADAEKDYDAAYENEHSFANRMISGASMGATGLGAMQLAQGLSEQKADDAAARDMEAYMATFQCKIGNKGGKTYTGGTKDIELPGANQLTPIYQEYVDLAASVKQRKNDLGMTPGIESQVILDKANMGLYDDEGHGIENGTYASLYRASKGNETDKQKLSEQKESSGNKVKVGAIATVGGALVGMVGNSLINGKLSKKIDEKQEKRKSKIDTTKTISILDKKEHIKTLSEADIEKLFKIENLGN